MRRRWTERSSSSTPRRAFATGYRPQFFFGVADVTGTIEADGPILPGARARARFTLDRAVALDEGVRFALREGRRTIGAGVVVSDPLS